MPSPPTYDPQLVRDAARRLLSDARALELAYAIAGAFLAGFSTFSSLLMVYTLPAMLRSTLSSAVDLFGNSPAAATPSMAPVVVGSLVGAAFGGYVGYRVARTRSGLLRLQAHLGLCQVEIERRLRGG